MSPTITEPSVPPDAVGATGATAVIGYLTTTIPDPPSAPDPSVGPFG